MNNTRPLDALRRFWWVVLVFTIGGLVVGGLPEPEQAADSITRWTASHTLLVSNTSNNAGGFTDPQSFNQLQLFATTGQVPARAAEAIGYKGEPAALAAQLVVSADQESGALRIGTTQETAAEAVEVADAIAEELTAYLAERQDQLREDRITSTLSRLEELKQQVAEVQQILLVPATDQFGPEALPAEDPIARAELDALSRQYSVVFEQFNLLQADQGQLVLTTLERAQPIAIQERGLSAPQSRRARGVLGGLVGAAIGFGVALLLARADRKIRTDEQATELLGMGINTTIPAVRHHSTAELAVRPGQHGPLPDSYRTLRSMIAFLDATNEKLSDRASITVVVSPGPSDGKTSIAANLAAAMVESGARTVAVNTDFRRPTLSKRLGVLSPEPTGVDLASTHDAPLELMLAPGDNPALAVLDLSGVRGNNPGDLARATSRLLPRVAMVADSVVVDTSPIGATAEVLEVIPGADNIIMVVRLGHTTTSGAGRAIEKIRSLSTGNLLLVVLGGATGDSGNYYYYTQAGSKQAGWFGRRKPKDTPITT